MESDLFDPYERLVSIEILGQRREVPERNTLLRCFQFLSMQTISYGDFCWNGDCTNCQFWYREPAEPDAPDKTALACRAVVREGMVITKLSRFVELEGINRRAVAEDREDDDEDEDDNNDEDNDGTRDEET
ncbi:MAG TPA: hypothetical protein VGV59_04010 [Pyrinomonadaceae bacterium]|nr:hypothetical protein [Pyrinomonadaceae bacterium]